jgi:hypothetical protein
MAKPSQTTRTEAGGNTHGLHPSDFRRFLDYLTAQLHLPPAQQAVLA